MGAYHAGVSAVCLFVGGTEVFEVLGLVVDTDLLAHGGLREVALRRSGEVFHIVGQLH